jgi:RNA polymerase-binding transcription factor DksA
MALTSRQTQELQTVIERRRAALLAELHELRGLEAARTRLGDGSYGICAGCGADIGFERLRANPAAVRCVECQRVHEKTYASPGGSSL